MNLRSNPPHDAIDSPLADLLFNRGADPMWVLDVTGSVVRANEAARAAFTARRPVFIELMKQALDDELPTSGRWTADIPVVDVDESVVQMRATLSSIDDAASHFLCTMRAPFEAYAEASPEAGEPLTEASDDSPAMMWMAGTDARREWFSKPWLDFTSTPLAEQKGDGWLANVHPEDQERLRGIAEASSQARYPFTLDYRLRRSDGSWRWVMDSGLPRHAGDGSFCGYVGSCIDIHERKELEDRLAERARALRLADHRKDEFLAMLSHELRNPLAPIANAAGLLRLMEKDNAPLGRVRVIVERQVEQLRRLIGDMVDMTRLTQHKISLSCKSMSVEALIEQALASARGRIDMSAHTVQVVIEPTDAWVEVDPNRMSQAIGNLVSNAAKFMPSGGTIRIKASVDQGRLTVGVSDSGQGIEADFLPHVFELFAQQDQSLARLHGGLGVGLTIARRIVQLHGGDVEAHSDGPNRGAEFVITVPVPRTGARAEREPAGALA